MPPKQSARRPKRAHAEHAQGTVIATHGRHMLVAVDNEQGRLREAFSRGRRGDACVGDRVSLSLVGDQQAAVETIHPRNNLIRRSDGGRSKALAANIDLAAIVLAGSPPFSEELLMRVLAVTDTEGVEALIIAGKADLRHSNEAIEPRLALYESMGYRVIRVSAKHDTAHALTTLTPLFKNRTVLLLGQSGMGKSTLINLLVPEAEQATREISEALSSGRHTTSFCRMFRSGANLPEDAAIIDSPGFQLFGIAHVSRSQLMHALPDFRPLLGRCRFTNCLHKDEPGCAISAAVEAGAIDARRHQLYHRLLDDTLT